MNALNPAPTLSARRAIILCNLGTPEAPTASAVRRYLGEFLADRRVVEIPRAIWLPILHGIILRIRPAKSAEKYRSVWLPEGSPLMVHTQRQARALQQHLSRHAAAHAPVPAVYYAMRYGKPNIATQMQAAVDAGAEHITLVSLYPQYSGTTTASVLDALGGWCQTQRKIPAIRTVTEYRQSPAYIAALAHSVRNYWETHGRGEILLMSFHGVPERNIRLGDPYEGHCYDTARALARALELSDEQWRIAFQSRFGRAKWITPATDTTLELLGGEKRSRIDLICPSFTSDCLETLEEIAIEGKEIFQHAGGGQYHYIPCLNDNADWIAALAQMSSTPSHAAL